MTTDITVTPDVGFHLKNDARTILLRGIYAGRDLTDGQIIQYGAIAKMYQRNIAEESLDLPERTEEDEDNEIAVWLSRSTIMDLPPKVDCPVVYKYTKAEFLEKWLEGTVRLTPPTVYRAIENPHARDEEEGYGTFYIHDGHDNAAVFDIAAGFNTAAICLTRHPPTSAYHAEMQQKFGPRVVQILDVHQLMAILTARTGAVSYDVRDVHYSDIKAFRYETEMARDIAGLLNAGGSLANLYDLHGGKLRELGEAPAIFCKPYCFHPEAERRAILRFASDVDAPIIVSDPRIKDLIKVVA
ncbi:hypothetical protein HB775_16680 [Rhizobium leguminosarum bv. trifolii]|nr:hypothetical protein HB775_16680 [Rhizobium leguminosarum bv. trifolii]